MDRRSALLALAACTFACRGDRGPDVSTPEVPDVPVAVRPAEGGAVDSQTPSLVVVNARGFDAGQATYEFLVLDAAGTRVVQDIKDVAAGKGVGVDVSGSPDGPWLDLGTQPCGDGGTGDRSNHCDFDLSATGLRAARYVRVSDGERYPCERAGTRSEGADIDAVQALHVRN